MGGSLLLLAKWLMVELKNCKNRKIDYFHSFKHIAHLSCRYGHFRNVLVIFGRFKMAHEIKVTYLKIVNKIDHNSKNKYRKIEFSLVSAGIFKKNLSISELGLHICNWDMPNNYF